MSIAVRQLLQQIQQQLIANDLWQAQSPSVEALSSTAPFCCDTLTFQQWLQFVLIPKMTALLDGNAPLPTKVAIAPMAEQCFDGQPQLQPLITLLQQFDALLSRGEHHA